VHPGQRPEEGVGTRETKKERAQLVADIAAGKFGEKVEPEKIRTLSQLLDGSEPVKAFETSAHDYFCASLSMVGLLIHAAVGSLGGLGLRFPNRQGLAV
jgi:hypothetical protein